MPTIRKPFDTLAKGLIKKDGQDKWIRTEPAPSLLVVNFLVLLHTSNRLALGCYRPRTPTDPYVLALEHTVLRPTDWPSATSGSPKSLGKPRLSVCHVLSTPAGLLAPDRYAGRWSGATGRAFHPQESIERFPSSFLYLIPLSQDSWRNPRHRGRRHRSALRRRALAFEPLRQSELIRPWNWTEFTVCSTM